MKDSDKDEKGKCIHDGHRKRLTETVNRVGLDGLSNIQVLEYILFFIFPRGDVNPLAHRLLDRFENVHTVLEASVEDLMEVKGIGEMAGQKIHSLLEVFYYYTAEKLNYQPLKTLGDFLDYVEQLLRYRAEEELHVFGVNISGEVEQGRCLAKGNNTLVGVNMRDIALYVSTAKVKKAYLVHNHPGGSSTPSEQDKMSYDRMKGIFTFTGCRLADSFVIGKDGIYSMERKSIIRVFSEGLEYLQSLLLEDSQEE